MKALEFYILQCFYVAVVTVHDDHAGHFCPYWFMARAVYSGLYHEHFCEECARRRENPTAAAVEHYAPIPVSENDSPMRWN